MNKLLEYKYIILIVLLILGFSFYWYSYKPKHDLAECHEKAFKSVFCGVDGYCRDDYQGDKDLEYTREYTHCLREKGL